MVNITSTSMGLRRATAACGIAACSLAMFFGLLQIAGFGALLAPAMVMLLSLAWVVFFCLACLLGAASQCLERRRFVLLPQPIKLVEVFSSLMSILGAPDSPPPRFAS